MIMLETDEALTGSQQLVDRLSTFTARWPGNLEFVFRTRT